MSLHSTQNKERQSSIILGQRQTDQGRSLHRFPINGPTDDLRASVSVTDSVIICVSTGNQLTRNNKSQTCK